MPSRGKEGLVRLVRVSVIIWRDKQDSEGQTGDSVLSEEEDLQKIHCSTS